MKFNGKYIFVRCNVTGNSSFTCVNNTVHYTMSLQQLILLLYCMLCFVIPHRCFSSTFSAVSILLLLLQLLLLLLISVVV